jgi:molecular chaperone GrpE
MKSVMSEKEHQETTEPTAEATVNTTEQEQGSVHQSADNQENKAPSSQESLQAEVAELKDKYLRLLAEFDNYRKRVSREKIEIINTAAQDTLSALLPVLDDFDRAKRIAEQEGSTEPFSEGMQLLYHKLYSVLRQKGLEPMESNGIAFNAEQHEAITEIPAPTEELKGKIVDTIEKGYSLHGKIIRYAKVVVGK